MNSVFKLSLFAAALAFAVPNVVMAAPAQHQKVHKNNKGHHHSKKVKTTHNSRVKHYQQSQGDQETADLNARSLQVVQSVNDGRAGNVQQVVPNPQNQLPPSARVPLSGNQNTSNLNRDSLQDATRYNNRRVIVAPGTGNTVTPPAAPAGAINPNNMPPAQY